MRSRRRHRPAGCRRRSSWAAPQTVDYGNYVLCVETAKTYDFNATYNETTFPSPTGHSVGGLRQGVARSAVGRLQRAVHDRRDTRSARSTHGLRRLRRSDRMRPARCNPPDATITTRHAGLGCVAHAARLRRQRDVSRARARDARARRGRPGERRGRRGVRCRASTTATLAFVAPGDDGTTGRVTGYEVRVRVGSPITDRQLHDSHAGQRDRHAGRGRQRADASSCRASCPRPTTSIGVRAFDNCFNEGELAVDDVHDALTARSPRSIGASSRPRPTVRSWRTTSRCCASSAIRC